MRVVWCGLPLLWPCKHSKANLSSASGNRAESRIHLTFSFSDPPVSKCPTQPALHSKIPFTSFPSSTSSYPSSHLRGQFLSSQFQAGFLSAVSPPQHPQSRTSCPIDVHLILLDQKSELARPVLGDVVRAGDGEVEELFISESAAELKT